MREIVFDTETTGFTFGEDRMVEIGCVELINRCETGRTFHAYFHPERTMPPGAFAIHGLSDAFLADKPLFPAVAEELIAFVGDAPLIAHNASFDFGFLNGELGRCGRDLICTSRMVDTLAIAKQRHPGAKLTLDALCSRYGIDRSHRVLHGALLDAQLLAQVYVELMGGRQIGLSLVSDLVVEEVAVADAPPRPVRAPRHFAPSDAELTAHSAFMTKIKNPIWGAAASG
ncbi:DNA polymerase III subunit epsilon [Sphingomonas sp. ABOLG]|jgi:DNA polymerase-3 subunit epsilon|uniref:DNA polymerase III subunit epsilon n=1 Tax=Sphingomonas TaxID=13687 RepID=UPI0006221D8D|nr:MULTISPECIES: DNA polymerase III subunit epsilon [unclassified Sphingomonas]KKI18848.1 DNA polymerase III subunit epsilon [Sphingomonas sp. Ag1]MDF2605092.1 dnaQ [Sphingomonas sp.]RSV18200.1 DNA polymerase III subunit epsilon [Sphingomonas sp. ABOLG]